MKTRVEDTVAVEESKEVILHCSIRGYHITVWSKLWRIEHAPLSERVHAYDAGGH